MHFKRLLLTASLLFSPFFIFAADEAITTGACVQSLKITVLSTTLTDVKKPGEWDFAALVEVDGHRLLFDTGAHSDAVLRNAAALGIDLTNVPDVILSHNHSDHLGGLMTLRRSMAVKVPDALARVHVVDGIYDSSASSNQEIKDNPLILLKPEYEKTGGVFITCSQPRELFPGVWLTGPIPRKYPEKNWGTKGTVQTPAGVVDDCIPGDQALIFNTDKGLVALLGCGHAGIVNTLEYARHIVRPALFHAVIGGCPLFSPAEETPKWTAEKLAGFGIENFSGLPYNGSQSTYWLRLVLGLDRGHAVVTGVGNSFELDKDPDPRVIAK